VDKFRTVFIPNYIFFVNNLSWPVWSKTLAEGPQCVQGSDRLEWPFNAKRVITDRMARVVLFRT
jgi:hypothetical protein